MMIDLISIGIAAEDGREYYAQSLDVIVESIPIWVWDNVIPHLNPCLSLEVSLHLKNNLNRTIRAHQERQREHTEYLCPPGCPWRTRKQIRDEISAFLDPGKYGKPEFYTWCGTYDHIALCQLWGKMVDTPEWFPHHVYDLQCELSDRCISDEELPQQSGTAHNALDDAQHIKHLWGVACGHYAAKDPPILPPYVG